MRWEKKWKVFETEKVYVCELIEMFLRDYFAIEWSLWVWEIFCTCKVVDEKVFSLLENVFSS